MEINIQNDEEFEILSDKYKNLLRNKQSLEENFKSEAFNRERLIGVVTDFYIDNNKFKGINVKNKLESLQDALRDYNTEILLETFCDNKKEKWERSST